MMNKHLTISFLIAFILLNGCATAGKPEPLTAQGLFERFVSTAYGEEGMAAHSSITSSGTLIIENFGMEAPIVTRQMAPDFFLFTTELMGPMTQGCRAELCWTQQPGQSPALAQGGQLELMLQQADFHQWENMAKHYTELEVVPQDNENSMSYHKVRALRANGVEDFYYFSKESGLLIGSQLTADTPMGTMKMTNRMNNYQEFGSILLPVETIQESSMATVRVVLDDVSFEPLTEADFPLPENLEDL